MTEITKDMAEASTISIESRLFDLAELLVVLRFWAECYWIDVDFDPGREAEAPDALAVVVRQLSVVASAASDALRPNRAATSLAAFADAVAHFWSHYRTVWPRAIPLDRLSEFRNVDPEFAYDRDRYIFDASPLADADQWGRVRSATDSLLAALEPGPRACFELSALLGGEVWATFAGGQRARDTDSELAYLTVHLADLVRQSLRGLTNHAPFLRGIEVDFSAATVIQARRRVKDLWQRIGSLLRNPLGAPGYLGLVLDRSAGQVCRAGTCYPLRGAIGWALLVQLERNGAEFCGRKTLERCWGPALHDAPVPETLDRAISDLRTVLRPLGILVKNNRNIGWRLEDGPDGSSGDRGDGGI